MPDDTNNTPSEVGPQADTSGGGGEGVKSWAESLATTLNITVAEATKRLKAYVAENGGDYQHAAVALANKAPTTGGDGSSGSSGGGGGSSSGGSSAAAGPSPQDLRNAEASYRAILTSWGVPLTPALDKLIKSSVKLGVSSQAFVEKMRTTKEYAQRFAGILKPNGTLRMTEAQYISGYNSAKDYAASIGRNLSPQLYGLAVKNGNSPSEIKMRLDTLDKLKSYAPQLAEFNDYLVTTGKIKKPLDRKGLADFIMGKNPQLQQEWEVANTAFQLQELAGVNIDKPKQGGDESYKELSGQIKRFQALGGDLDSIDFAKMGSLIGQVIPKNELYGQGIRKRDIVEMMLSGKNAGEITKRVQTVLDTYEAAVTEPGAQPQNYAGQPNTRTPQRGSE